MKKKVNKDLVRELVRHIMLRRVRYLVVVRLFFGVFWLRSVPTEKGAARVAKRKLAELHARYPHGFFAVRIYPVGKCLHSLKDWWE